MYPTFLDEFARYHQADRLREAERARLAHEVRMASDRPRRRFRLWRRSTSPAYPKPAYER